MKYLVAILALSSMIGCASQPSTYEDRSTPEQRDIKATGQAATEAARSNSSKNADIKMDGLQVSHNSHQQQNVNQHRYIVYRPDGTRDHRAELRLMQQSMQNNNNGRGNYGTYTQTRAAREFDHRLKRKIDAEVDRFMEKIF